MQSPSVSASFRQGITIESSISGSRDSGPAEGSRARVDVSVPVERGCLDFACCPHDVPSDRAGAADVRSRTLVSLSSGHLVD